eukprot:4785531-Amphidinium_carterae.1
MQKSVYGPHRTEECTGLAGAIGCPPAFNQERERTNPPRLSNNRSIALKSSKPNSSGSRTLHCVVSILDEI